MARAALWVTILILMTACATGQAGLNGLLWMAILLGGLLLSAGRSDGQEPRETDASTDGGPDAGPPEPDFGVCLCAATPGARGCSAVPGRAEIQAVPADDEVVARALAPGVLPEDVRARLKG
jgi:hypothetical protein